MVDFGGVRAKLRSPKLSKLWAILAAICYAAFTSTTGGPGTTPTYERTVAGILGAILVAVHTAIMVSNRPDNLVPWIRTRNNFILLLPLLLVMILMITMVITAFLFKFPYFQVNNYTLFSALAFAVDVFFLQLWVAHEVNVPMGWVFGCLFPVYLMLSTEPRTWEPGYEGYYSIWFSILTYLVYIQL